MVSKEELYKEIEDEMDALRKGIMRKIDNYNLLCIDHYEEHPDLSDLVQSVLDMCDMIDEKKQQTIQILEQYM